MAKVRIVVTMILNLIALGCFLLGYSEFACLLALSAWVIWGFAQLMEPQKENQKPKWLTHYADYYLTGAYAGIIKVGDQKFLVISHIEEDVFRDGNECTEDLCNIMGWQV